MCRYCLSLLLQVLCEPECVKCWAPCRRINTGKRLAAALRNLTRTYVLLVPSHPVQLVADLVDLDLEVGIEADANQSDLRLVNAECFAGVSQVHEDEKKI